ncbi:MAG: orotate phosphoribosyltransferase [Prevotellaceae bacterium]|jgi:orotate phosphoribosyltransferase|nr:orotate phosphoribosyltransferase [Prevotellaceae bacterium]
MCETAKQTAKDLLRIKAVKINVNNHFVWASGWNSPVYCDNRKTLSYPDIRKLIYTAFVEKINEKYSDCEVIAGVATGAIAHGILVAETLNKPFVYVRSSPKAHGMENLIEGELTENSKVVVIEDLVSTGGSSIAAVNAIRKANCKVLGMLAIFSYEFDAATENFRAANCDLTTLCDYTTLLNEAINCGYINASDMEIINNWRKSPETWKK